MNSISQKEFEEFMSKPGSLSVNTCETPRQFKNYLNITSVCSIIGIFSLGIVIGWIAKDCKRFKFLYLDKNEYFK